MMIVKNIFLMRSSYVWLLAVLLFSIRSFGAVPQEREKLREQLIVQFNKDYEEMLRKINEMSLSGTQLYSDLQNVKSKFTDAESSIDWMLDEQEKLEEIKKKVDQISLDRESKVLPIQDQVLLEQILWRDIQSYLKPPPERDKDLVPSYLSGIKDGILNWHNCDNAPKELRLELAAKLAFDAKELFAQKNILTIALFATGGHVNAGAQLLQEFTIIDALARVWPTDHNLQINISLIGPELIQKVRARFNQVDILTQEINDLLKKLNRSEVIRVNINTFSSSHDYIEAIQNSRASKSDILIGVDFEGDEKNILNEKHNMLSITNKEKSKVDLLVVDVSNPDEKIPNHFQIFYLSRPFKQEEQLKLVSELRSIINPLLIEWEKASSSILGSKKEFIDSLQVILEKKGFVVKKAPSLHALFKELTMKTLQEGGLVYNLQNEWFGPRNGNGKLEYIGRLALLRSKKGKAPYIWDKDWYPPLLSI